MANRKNDIKGRLMATFRVEAEEHLQAITANLLALERGLPADQAREVVEATFREVHTLKGAARSVSLMDVEALCQACESLLSRITHGHLVLSRPILNRLQEAVDEVARLVAGGEARAARELIGRLEQVAAGTAAGAAERAEPGARPAETPVAPAGPALPPADTIRLATAKLDALLLQAEDLLVPKLATGEWVRQVRALVDAFARFRKILNRRPFATPGPRPRPPRCWRIWSRPCAQRRGKLETSSAISDAISGPRVRLWMGCWRKCGGSG